MEVEARRERRWRRTFSSKDIGTEFTAQSDTSWEGSEQLDDLRDVIVVFVVASSRVRIEEVVSC